MLYLLLRRFPVGTAAAATRRFSNLALGGVAVLIVAGVSLACVQLGRPEALSDTAYGRFLLLKLGLVAALLGLAAWNKRHLTPALARGDRRSAGRLRRSILVEEVVMVAVLAVTACLGQVPPPRALAEQDEHVGHSVAASTPGYTVYTSTDGIDGLLAVEPPHPGPVTLTIELTSTADGQRLRPVAVEAALSLPALGVEPMLRPAERIGDGLYRITGLVLPVAGVWTVEIAVLVTDFRKTSLTVSVPIQ
jgi:copper transport protein